MLSSHLWSFNYHLSSPVLIYLTPYTCSHLTSPASYLPHTCLTCPSLQLLEGNTNTYLAQTSQLSPPVIATRVRFLPYSDHPRTVCMRVELYGCQYSGMYVCVCVYVCMYVCVSKREN